MLPFLLIIFDLIFLIFVNHITVPNSKVYVSAMSIFITKTAPSTTLHRRQSNAAFGHCPSAETSFKRV